MKRFLLEFMILFVVLIIGGQVFAYSAIPASSGAPVTSRHFSNHSPSGVLKINSMSPATYRYPASYAHHTYTMPNSNMFYGYPINDMNVSNVNVFVGGYQPVYVMRSGMVKVNRNKNKRRSGRIKTTYEEEYYEN